MLNALPRRRSCRKSSKKNWKRRGGVGHPPDGSSNRPAQSPGSWTFDNNKMEAKRKISDRSSSLDSFLSWVRILKSTRSEAEFTSSEKFSSNLSRNESQPPSSPQIPSSVPPLFLAV